LSFSEELHSDDKTIAIEYEDDILNSDCVMTIKLDGGNCCIKVLEGVLARTHSTVASCPSFNYIKNVHYFAKLHLLNPDYWYFGENMYAIHSIEYSELDDYFYLFNIYDSKNDIWLSWEDLNIEAQRCNFKMVPFVIAGKLTTERIKHTIETCKNSSVLGGLVEGFVIRKVGAFKGDDFSKNVVKWVRKGHVQTDEHWSKNWVAAKLKDKE